MREEIQLLRKDCTFRIDTCGDQVKTALSGQLKQSLERILARDEASRQELTYLNRSRSGAGASLESLGNESRTILKRTASCQSIELE